MSASLTRRSPLPGVYSVPPYAFQGTAVFRRIPNPAMGLQLVIVQLDRSGVPVAIAKRSPTGTSYPAIDVPFPVANGAEYWAVAFAYDRGTSPVEWPAVAVVWSIQG